LAASWPATAGIVGLVQPELLRCRKGVAALEHWLATPEEPEPHLQPVMYAKVALACVIDVAGQLDLGWFRGRLPADGQGRPAFDPARSMRGRI
jgi:hypothetical protein